MLVWGDSARWGFMTRSGWSVDLWSGHELSRHVAPWRAKFPRQRPTNVWSSVFAAQVTHAKSYAQSAAPALSTSQHAECREAHPFQCRRCHAPRIGFSTSKPSCYHNATRVRFRCCATPTPPVARSWPATQAAPVSMSNVRLPSAQAPRDHYRTDGSSMPPSSRIGSVGV